MITLNTLSSNVLFCYTNNIWSSSIVVDTLYSSGLAIGNRNIFGCCIHIFCEATDRIDTLPLPLLLLLYNSLPCVQLVCNGGTECFGLFGSNVKNCFGLVLHLHFLLFLFLLLLLFLFLFLLLLGFAVFLILIGYVLPFL